MVRRMSEPLQVKGFAFLNLLEFVKDTWGPATVRELAQAFPEHAAHFAPAGVSAVGWLPGALHLGAVEWLVRHRYEGTLTGAQAVGRGLAERNLAGTFRSLTRLEDLKLALTSTERAFGQFYSRGTMKLVLDGGLLTARLTDFPGATPLFGNVLGAGLVAFLRAGHVDAALSSVTVLGETVEYLVTIAAAPLPGV